MSNIVDLSRWSSRFLWLFSNFFLSDFINNARIQVQINLVTLTTLKMSANNALLINSLDSLWQTLDNSLVIKNNDETTNEIDAFTRVTNVRSKLNIAQLSSFYTRKQSKTHDCLNSYIVIKFIILFLDCLITSNIVLS